MRHLELRQQPLQQQQAQPRTQHSGGTPASATAPRIDDTLDQAAALWTTRRIRSCLVLLDPSARPAHR